MPRLASASLTWAPSVLGFPVRSLAFVFIGSIVVLALNILQLNTSQTNTPQPNTTQPDISTKPAPVGRASLLPDLNSLALAAQTDDLKVLLERLARIKSICGSLCDNAASKEVWMQNSVPIQNSKLRLTLAPDINCQALMENPDIDAGDTTVPYPVPEELLRLYTMDGAVNFTNTHRSKSIYLGEKASTNIWTEKDVDEMVETIKSPQEEGVPGTYGGSCTRRVQKKLSQLNITGKHCLVIGSEKPWMEALLLALGATHVTTLEYGSIVSEHPQIDTMTPGQMRQSFLAGTMKRFDVIATHSSVEHSGLGRYGDALNPWGDLLAVARAWCVAKPDATMYLGVPIGLERIEFNMHRIYGKMTWSLLATNWIQIDGDQHRDSEFEFSTSRGPGLRCGGMGLLFKKVDKFVDYLT